MPTEQHQDVLIHDLQGHNYTYKCSCGFERSWAVSGNQMEDVDRLHDAINDHRKLQLKVPTESKDD
jgi:hypothetical protein